MSLFRAALFAVLLVPKAVPAQDPGPTLYIGYASLEPESPVAGQPVNLRFWTGPCVGITDDPDDTDITLDGSTITIIVDGIRRTNITFCAFPFWHHTYPIGSYPAGDYTLVAQLRYRPLFGQTVLETFGTLNFEITGTPETVPVPATGWSWLVILLLGIVLIAARRLHARVLPVLALLTIGLASSPVSAQPEPFGRLHVLLSAEVDPAQVVEAWRNGDPPGKPDLSHGQPALISHLLPFRTEGDFKARINANPDSARAKLERCIVLLYCDENDLATVVSVLATEPGAAGAGLSRPLSLSAASLSQFSIGTSFGMAEAGTQQYGRLTSGAVGPDHPSGELQRHVYGH